MATGGTVVERIHGGYPGSVQYDSAAGTATSTERDIEDLRKIIREGILNQLPKEPLSNPPWPQMLSSSELNPQSLPSHDPGFWEYSKHEYGNRFIGMHKSDSDSDSDSWQSEDRRIIRHFEKEKYLEHYRRHSQIEGDTDPRKELNSLKEKGHLCFTGPAGSGKSTLLKILAGNSVEGTDGYHKIKFVHVVYHEPFRKIIRCSAHRTLFSHSVEGKKFTTSESQRLFSFVDGNPNDVLLIIDGLDTLPQDLVKIKDPGSKYDPNKSYSPLVHLKMLLSGKLLDGCRVVTSSRNLAVRNFQDDLLLRHVKFVSLRGFSEADANKVLELRSPECAKNISKTFQDKPHFLSLFKEPLFLTFLIKIWENIKNTEFVGATNVMLEITKHLYMSEHKKGEYDKLSQVKKFAQKLLWQKQLAFDESTLAEYDLAVAHFKDLSTVAPDDPTTNNEKFPDILNRKIMIIFCHQSFHELFAAYNVLESKLSSFKTKLKKLHKPYYHKTRDFVYGLAFKEEESEFDAQVVADLCKKREALKSSIEEKFCKSSKFEQLAIFESLAEAISKTNHFNLKTTNGVDFSGIGMSDWNMYCTGIAVSQFNILQKLHLERCSLRPSHLRVLKQGLCKCNNDQLQILSFSLKGNKKIGKEGVGIACEIVRERNVICFNLGSCELNVECMEELQQGLQTTTVTVLVLKKNAVGKEGMDIAGKIVKMCSTEDVNLTKCATTCEEIQAFAESASGSQLDRLTATDDDGDVACGYGHVIKTCRVKTLVLSISAQQPDDGKRMKEYSATGKVAKLYFVRTKSPIRHFRQEPASNKNDYARLCDLIESLLPVVEEEVVVPVSFENVLFDQLSESLYRLDKRPKIRFCRDLNIITELGSDTVTLVKKEQRSDPVDQCVKSAEDEDAEEIGGTRRLMETEYLNISEGCKTLSWLSKNKERWKAVSEILSIYGLSMYQYDLREDHCDLLAKFLSPEEPYLLKSLSFSKVTGLDTLINALNRASTCQAQAKEICFIGYSGISSGLSPEIIVDFVEKFQAESLVLIAIDASCVSLKKLRTALQAKSQTVKSLKKLEIYHNPNMGDEEWRSLADIANNWAETPLHISASFCNVTDNHLGAFKKKLGSTKLAGIDLCGNPQLSDKGLTILGEIVRTSEEITSISLEDCELDAQKIQAFNSTCCTDTPSQIKFLNLADNPSLGPESFAEIKRTVECYKVESLDVSNSIPDDLPENFDFEHKFESLDLSENRSCINMVSLAKSANKKLYLRNCRMSVDELVTLASDLQKHDAKLEEVDVSDDSKEIDFDGMSRLKDAFKSITNSITFASDVKISFQTKNDKILPDTIDPT